jgi:hypothetical protein
MKRLATLPHRQSPPRFLSMLLGLWLFYPVVIPAQTIISEFMADNKKVLADEDGQYPDWIELYNTGTTTVNLQDWALTDDPTHQAKWLLPSTNLTAKGFLVVFASGKNRALPGAALHTDFNLKASGEYLGLLRPDGTVATEFGPAFPPQYPDISYGLAQDVTTNVLLSSGSPVKILVPGNGNLGVSWTQPGFDDSGWMGGTTGVGYETAVSGFAVYNYVANVGVCSLAAAQELIMNPAQQSAVYEENAPVINYLNTSDGAHFSGDRTFPGLTIGVDQDNYAVHAMATLTIPAAGNWTFGVNSDDGFQLTVGTFTMAYPDPRGPADTLQTFNFSSAGDYLLDLVFYECGGGSEVELFAAQGSFGSFDATHFRLVGDAANGGLTVSAPVVSSGVAGSSYRQLIQTDVQSQMQNVNASAYLRVPFTVANPSLLQSLTLRMLYDDGFVAYLNGQEIARRNAPATVQWNSTASAAHPSYQATVFEEINVSDALGNLLPGQNVLAVQGLNQSASDTDFLIEPELVEYRASSSTNKYFATPTPGGLNNSGFIAFVDVPKLSVEHGFFDSPVSVAATTTTEQASLRYTTDGSTPTLENGTLYTGPVTISATTPLRVAAFKDGYQPSKVATETYVFVSDVIHQSPNGETPAGWPSSWGGNTVDYGMDPNVVNAAAYRDEIAGNLKSIPSFSIATDFANLFDPVTGIYANPSGDGMEWERPASIELINPDGTKGFQIDGGIRIRGGYSRSTGNPKHAFRFFFRQEYGKAKLNYPMFAKQGGVESFDKFDLRTFENYSWSFEGDYRFIGLRDQFSRDTQLAMGQQGERGDFYHLYINGQYWGLYNTDERPEASFGESYFGGAQGDYDVIKVDTGAGYTIYATDGNMDAWTRLWQAAMNGFSNDDAYFKIEGLNTDGTPNPGYENLLDVDNLIDYMLVIFFTGNIDAPISAFLGDSNPNNLYAVRNRTGQYGGFRFMAHDSEHTLLHESSLGNNDELHRNRLGPFPAGDPTQQGAQAALARSNPQYVFTRLMANAEFRLRVADHVQAQFFNGGPLTTEACRARFLTRSNEIYRAVACESARWGDARIEPPRTRNVDWVKEMNRVYGDYFNQRPGIVLAQLKAKSLYPGVAAPVANQWGGTVPKGFQVTLSAPAGIIYYTRDGSDPRLRGGGRSPSAIPYGDSLTIRESTRLKARVLSGSTWSALIDPTFYTAQDYSGLLITELMYHPPDTADLGGGNFEFLEFKNVSGDTIDLSGVHFTSGIQYTFPVGSLMGPGQFVLLASNLAAFTAKYPGVPVDGIYSNQLSNSGETITLAAPGSNSPILSLTYGTRPPWPETADGAGFSLVPVNPNFNPDPNDPGNWRASAALGGSPGADDTLRSMPPIWVNEALTHTDLPQVDSVELYNPNVSDVDIGGWYLTDDRSTPRQYRIPFGTRVPASGYWVVTENQWNSDPASTNSFRLNSHGEQIYLFSADANGDLTGFSDGFAFGAAQNGVSFGRYVTSTGEIQYPAQRENTLGGANAGPRVGPVVINEIQYHPSVGQDEFVELKSITNGVVKFYDPLFPTNTWRLKGVGFDFPPNVEVAPGSLLLVVAIDPALFRTKYAVPSEVPIFGPYAGNLQGNGETLALQWPDHPDLNTNTGAVLIPYIDVDVVRYASHSPWPTNADGLGPSLERLNSSAYGNDPANWRASLGAPSPGLENTGNRMPAVTAGPDQVLTITNFPAAINLVGKVSDDGLPNPPGATTVQWSQVDGPGAAWFADASQASTTAFFPGAGSYTLRLIADDSALRASADTHVVLNRPASLVAVTLVSVGSVWKYLDDGSDQGTAWVALGFNDTGWKSGLAPLGYGDANGQLPATTTSYGPDPNDKYITTYFRRSFEVSAAAVLTNLTLNVQRDDGVIVYLNGQPVFTNNLPDGPIDFQTLAVTAVGGSDETAFYSQSIDPALLVLGSNILAAEIHQANGTSSDIIFDADLSGEAQSLNQPPQVQAGPDQTVTLPAPATITAAVHDDGLPIPPGLLTFAWSRLSGPGVVSFASATALTTTATFPVPGTYQLRLIVSDGASATSSDLTVTALGANPQNIEISGAHYSNGAAPVFQLEFMAQAGLPYTIQYRESLATGGWVKLADIPAEQVNHLVQFSDPDAANSKSRYYRIVSP